MTTKFILDENVLICAQQGVDPEGSPSAVCADLVQRIIDICHTIVIDEELWAKYMAQLNRPGQQHAQLGPYFTRILKGALTTADKIDGFGRYAAPFHDEGSIPPGSQDDTFIVRLAVETGAALVTNDEPLRNDLRTSGIESNHELTVLTPEDALKRLDTP